MTSQLSNSGADQQIDTMMIYNQTKARFLAEARQKLTFQERFEHSLPMLLMVILVVFFILSASHTATMINRIVPAVSLEVIGIKDVRVIGLLAPVGFELGLMVLAMMMTSAKLYGNSVPGTWLGAEVLLFLLTLISNLAGSVIAAMEYPKGENAAEITQALTLVVAIVFSFAIPVLSLVIGQGLARLVFERRTSGDAADMRWRAAAFEELRRAFFAGYRATGMAQRDAARRAEADAMNYAPQVVRPVVEVSVPSAAPRLTDGRTDRQSDRSADKKASSVQGISSSGGGSKREQALEYIRTNWIMAQGMSVRELVDAAKADGLDIGRDTVHKAFSEVSAEKGKSDNE